MNAIQDHGEGGEATDGTDRSRNEITKRTHALSAGSKFRVQDSIQRCQKLRNEPNRHSCRLVCIGGSSKNYQTNPICVELAQSLSTPVRLRVENIWDPAVSDRRYTFFAKRTQLIFSPSAKSVKSAVQQFLPNEAKAGSAAVPGCEFQHRLGAFPTGGETPPEPAGEDARATENLPNEPMRGASSRFRVQRSGNCETKPLFKIRSPNRRNPKEARNPRSECPFFAKRSHSTTIPAACDFWLVQKLPNEPNMADRRSSFGFRTSAFFRFSGIRASDLEFYQTNPSLCIRCSTKQFAKRTQSLIEE